MTQNWDSSAVESDPFLKDANLDLRGRRLDLANMPLDEPDAFLEGSNLVREVGIRREIEALADDPAVLEQLAKTDPAAAARLEEQRAEAAALEFIAATPEYYVCESNSDRLDSYLQSKQLPWTAENLAAACAHLLKLGALKVNPHVLRVVPASEKIRLARMAADGDMQTALSGYLQLRLPKAVCDEMSNSEEYSVVEAFLSEPSNQPTFNEALIEVWFWGHPTIRPTNQLRDWFSSYTEHMTTFNLKTLDAAWLAHFDHRETQNELQKRNALLGLRGELPPDPEPTQAEVAASLEDLPDSEIARLMRGVARERAGRPA